jgi:two-component system, NarL family, invasion response regulator UvrY
MTSSKRARVLVVDDSPTFLTLLGEVIGRTTHLELAGKASSGELAVQLTDDLRPDIAVIDVNMPGMGGIEAAKRIKNTCAPALLVLVSATLPDELPHGVRSVVDAVIPKADLAPELLDRLWLDRLKQGA